MLSRCTLEGISRETDKETAPQGRQSDHRGVTWSHVETSVASVKISLGHPGFLFGNVLDVLSSIYHLSLSKYHVQANSCNQFFQWYTTWVPTLPRKSSPPLCFACIVPILLPTKRAKHKLKPQRAVVALQWHLPLLLPLLVNDPRQFSTYKHINIPLDSIWGPRRSYNWAFRSNWNPIWMRRCKRQPLIASCDHRNLHTLFRGVDFQTYLLSSNQSLREKSRKFN